MRNPPNRTVEPAEQKCEPVVTEIVDVRTDLAVDPRALWDLLIDPRIYSRVFPGIGACDALETLDETPTWRMRIGGADADVRILDIRVIAHRETGSLELQYTEKRSFAVIHLRGDGDDRTNVTITCVAPEQVHPLMAVVANAAVSEWITAGLHRVVDLVRGAQTSIAVNGEDSSVRTQAGVAKHIMSTGVLRSMRPDRVIRQVGSLVAYGFTLAGGYAAATGHSPHRTALIDSHRTSTFGEIHTRTQALAGALADRGIGVGDMVGVLARNHTEMVEITTTLGKLGADYVLLTTGLSAERLAAIAETHRMAAIFVDPALSGLVSRLPPSVACYTTVVDPARPDRATVEDLIGSGSRRFDKPEQPGRLFVLTSGTTGAPKITLRPIPSGFSSIAALLSKLPFDMHETMMIPAPLSHSWGLAVLHLSLPLRATVVLLERFDARECLRMVAEHQVNTLIVVPIMLQRILDLSEAARSRYDTSSLRMVVCGGATLSEATALRFIEAYGDILYNLYGSTEVSWATIASPTDLSISPATVGRPPLGTKIAILDRESHPLPVGATGRIFVGHNMLFEGYLGDVPPLPEVDGMLYTGDYGYLDATGRLFISGRDTEAILCAGETVFPRPVEEALSYHPQISEVAVLGVPDRDSGQRLAAFIVPRDNTPPDPDTIRIQIRHRLGRLSVPRDIVFLDTLPRNAAGNILKRILTPVPRYGT